MNADWPPILHDRKRFPTRGVNPREKTCHFDGTSRLILEFEAIPGAPAPPARLARPLGAAAAPEFRPKLVPRLGD